MPQASHKADRSRCTLIDHGKRDKFSEGSAYDRKPLHPGTTQRDAYADLPAFDVKPADGAFVIDETLNERYDLAVVMPKHDDGHDVGPAFSVYASGPTGTFIRKLRDSGNCLQNCTVPRIGPRAHQIIWQLALLEAEKEAKGKLPKIDRRIRRKLLTKPAGVKTPRPSLDTVAGTTIATFKVTAEELGKLHPEQRRTTTVREMARLSGASSPSRIGCHELNTTFSAGFPDSFNFVATSLQAL